MNLSEFVSEVANDIRTLLKLRDKLKGGAAGQAPIKNGPDDFDFDWAAAGGGIDVQVDNLDDPDHTDRLDIRYPDGSRALRKTGTGEYQLLAAATAYTQCGFDTTSIPVRGSIGAVLFDYADSVYFESQSLADAKPVSFVQLGAGAIKIDGMAIRCKALPVSDGANAIMAVTRLGFDVLVSGDVAAAEAAPYYSGLQSDHLINQSIVGGDIGGFQNATASSLCAAALHYFPAAKTYVEFTCDLARGSFGFATSDFNPGLGTRLGDSPFSIGLRVDGADLIAVSDNATIATFAGEGGRGSTTARWGLLVDPVAKQWWLLANGTWVGPGPNTDPGNAYFADDFGFSRPAIEAAATLGSSRLWFAPGLMSYGATATAAGAAQLGMVAP